MISSFSRHFVVLALALGLAGPAHSHLPGQPPHKMALLGDLQLESGAVVKDFKMTYVTHGTLNAAKDNTILFITGFAANHHLFDHVIGPGRPLDTNKYFIVCPDPLGASQTTYEHSTSPTSSGLKMKFPLYNSRDMVNSYFRLITESLGIPHLLAVTGVSGGGAQSVQFAVSYPQFMDGIFPVAGSAFWGTNVQFIVDLMKTAIESCKGWEGGNYDENPRHCAANALSTFASHFHSKEWWNQYLDTPEAFVHWRNTFGDYYLDIQDARDLYYQAGYGSRSWIGDTPGFNGDIKKTLGSITARTLFIYSPYDQFHMPRQIDAQVRMIPNSRALAIDSTAGHLFCCNADPNATRIMGGAIRSFLQELGTLRGAK